ncbi:MAG: hypothetical protein WCO51_03940 [bacterium]
MINIGTRRELMVDTFLIDKMSKVRLEMHHPIPKEIVMSFDERWEGNDCKYQVIFKDGDIFRTYYNSWTHVPTTGPLHDDFIGYAESKDGIRWTKPALGLFEFEGSKKNNIVWSCPSLNNFSCFKDLNPNCAPDARYKAIHNWVIDGYPFMRALKSTDGIHWTLLTDKPVLDDGSFDSLNTAFWDAEQGVYRAYYRDFIEQLTRGIKTATSSDFINWTKGEWLEYPGTPNEALYTNAVAPYYRAPHIYMGFPMRYLDRGWSEEMKALPMLKEREERSKTQSRYGSALTDGLFMTSRDGKVFNRWLEAFIRPGLRSEAQWVYGDNCQAWGLIETKSDMTGAPDEISIYATEHLWQGPYTDLRRYVIRVDGFVSMNATGKGGEFTTKPITFKGKELEMNFSTSVAGYVRIEIQDADGSPIPGYTLKDSPEIFGDQLDRVVAWKTGKDVSQLAGKPIRLRFVMRDADLYSFKFRE